MWWHRLQRDTGRQLPRERQVHATWRHANLAGVDADARRVLDGAILLDAIRHDCLDVDADELARGFMLSERFLGPWASEPRIDRHVSPATARRRLRGLVDLGLVVDLGLHELAPGRRPARLYRLAFDG